MIFAEVYCSEKFVGYIHANNVRDLKRKASILCNRRYSPVDEMLVYMAFGKDANCRYTRINKVYPNNTITRGTWK